MTKQTRNFWTSDNNGTRPKAEFFLLPDRATNREDVKNKNVIYICENDFVKEELEQVEAKLAKAGKLEGAGLFFQFVTLASFYKIYSNNPTHKEEKQ